MPLNKIVVRGQTLLDLSNDTVSSNNLLKGVTAHDLHGRPVEGTIETWTEDQIEVTDATLEVGGDGALYIEDQTDYFELVDEKIRNIRPAFMYIGYDLSYYTGASVEFKVTGINFKNVETVGAAAFFNCPYLSEINLPNCKTIGAAAFSGAGYSASYYGSSIVTSNTAPIKIPNLEYVGSSAFYYYGNMQYFITDNPFPKLKHIEDYGFGDYYGSRFYFGDPDSFTDMTFSQLSYIGYQAFASCAFNTLRLPVVQTINDSAFYSCYKMFSLYLDTDSSITMPPALQNIYAFDCTPMRETMYKPETGEYEYGSIYVPGRLYGKFLQATNWSQLAERIVPIGTAFTLLIDTIKKNVYDNLLVEKQSVAVIANLPEGSAITVEEEGSNLFNSINYSLNGMYMDLSLTSNGTPGTGTIKITVTNSETNEVSIERISIEIKNQEVSTTYSVENISTTYGFVLNSKGYYESNNKGKDSSFALCKLNLNTNIAETLTITYINSGENGCDYGIFSNIDKTLTNTNSGDTTNVYKKCTENTTATRTLTYTIPEGEHFIYIKFRKDGSVSNGNDSLQFKISDNFELE